MTEGFCQSSRNEGGSQRHIWLSLEITDWETPGLLVHVPPIPWVQVSLAATTRKSNLVLDEFNT